jgi:hypothetical protein
MMADPQSTFKTSSIDKETRSYLQQTEHCVGVQFSDTSDVYSNIPSICSSRYLRSCKYFVLREIQKVFVETRLFISIVCVYQQLSIASI